MKSLAITFLLLGCLTACDDEDQDPAADARVSADGGTTPDMAPPVVGVCSPAVEDVYPSPACTGPVPELLIQDDDLPLARELLVGRWYRCSPGEIFIEDEDTDGIEFTADGEWYSLKSPTPGERPERLMDPQLHGTWEIDARDGLPPVFRMKSSDEVLSLGGPPLSIGCDPHQLAMGRTYLARGPGAGPAPAVATVADFPDEDCAPGDLQTPMDTDEGAVLAGLAGLWRLCSGDRERKWLQGPGDIFGLGLTVEGVWTRLLRVGDQVVLGQHVGDVGGFFVFEDDDQIWRVDFGPPIDSGFPYINGELRVSEQPGRWQLETFDGEVFLFSGPRGEQR